MNQYQHELLSAQSDVLEFKPSTSLLKEAVLTLCAFANHNGGVLYFGVADDGKACVRVCVEQSPLKPHVAYGRPYIRVGHSTRQLSKDQYLPVDQVLEKLDLVKEGIISNAAVLLFGKNPARYFSGHYEIKIASFPSDTGYSEMTNEHEYTGNLLGVFTNVMDFLLNSLRKSYVKGEQNCLERLEFPKTMLRESLVNMIAHRDYRVDVKSTIEVRPSSILFYNPAQLFSPTITMENLKRLHPSRPGNKFIAKIFYMMGLLENRGGGTLLIIENARQNSGRDPEFDFQDGMFSLKVHRKLNST